MEPLLSLLTSYFFRVYTSWGITRSILNIVPQSTAVFVPLLGYAILFNDFMLNFISFNTLTGAEQGVSESQIRMTYFGLIIISIARVMYSIRCNSIVRRHENAAYYYRDELSNTSYDEVENALKSILEEKSADEHLSSDLNNHSVRMKAANAIYSKLDNAHLLSRIICLFLAFLGLIMLTYPSFILFFRVVAAIL